MTIPPGARDNGIGLTRGWALLGECDPRLADELLGALRVLGVAAYAEPSAGRRGGALEVRLPRRPLDRLFVDASGMPAAHRLWQQHQAEHDQAAAPPAHPADPPVASSEDAVFAEIVAGLRAQDLGEEPGGRRWPVAEDIDTRVRPGGETGLLDPGGLLYDSAIGEGRREPGADPFEGDDNHFVPPEPTPGPPIHAVTKAGIAALLTGIFFLFAPVFGLFEDDTVSDVLGACFVIGGIAALVSRLRDDDPDGPGRPDGGAVV